MKNILRHLSSFFAPILMCFILPWFIVQWEHSQYRHSVITTSTILLCIGAIITTAGFILAIATIRMFILIGNGTIMPWDPTKKLIVISLYGYVRNPMILGIIIIQIGESILLSSYGIAVLAVLNYFINTVYFIFSEEPGLEKRFGKKYTEYKKNVPRWIPRLKPWKPNKGNE